MEEEEGIMDEDAVEEEEEEPKEEQSDEEVRNLLNLMQPRFQWRHLTYRHRNELNCMKFS